MEVIIKYENKLQKDHVEKLYMDAGWSAYTNDMELLMKAIESSLFVVTAWDEDKLVGLVRVVGDGFSIAYIQDILVMKEYKRLGIGARLLNIVLDKYTHVRQKVLLTEDSKETRGFYEKLGFKSCDKGVEVAFSKYN